MSTPQSVPFVTVAAAPPVLTPLGAGFQVGYLHFDTAGKQLYIVVQIGADLKYTKAANVAP